MTDNVSEGWGSPVEGEKWHYFVKDVTAPSLCRKYTWFGVATLAQGNDDSSSNCAACKRRLAARKAKEAK